MREMGEVSSGRAAAQCAVWSSDVRRACETGGAALAVGDTGLASSASQDDDIAGLCRHHHPHRVTPGIHDEEDLIVVRDAGSHAGVAARGQERHGER